MKYSVEQGRRTINFEEILSRAHGYFEEQIKILDCAIIIVNYALLLCIVII